MNYYKPTSYVTERFAVTIGQCLVVCRTLREASRVRAALGGWGQKITRGYWSVSGLDQKQHGGVVNRTCTLVRVRTEKLRNELRRREELDEAQQAKRDLQQLRARVRKRRGK